MSVRITYLVHGTTTDNENDRATGWNPGELSELGVQQSKDLLGMIKDPSFDVAFSSDQKRAVDSAEIAFGDKFTLLQDLRLRECNYGDMNGGLAVISDVPKTAVYDLARFINAEKEYIPSRIITKTPSAELKPDQTDQDDLPPYDILDSILKGYIEDFKGADELVKMGFNSDLVEDVISRVDRNEYKRYQAAPGLKVTSKAFGYGRRYPLAQRYTTK